MCVMVDHEPLEVEALGLTTVGQVLSHVRRDGGRLVVNVLIDGREPDPGQIGSVRRSALDGRTLFIETADSRQMALAALAEVEYQLCEAERLRAEAVELLGNCGVQSNCNAAGKAGERLSGCLTTWQHARESVLNTARLLRLELSTVAAGGSSLEQLLADFAGQIRRIKSALESRDFAALTDILTHEAAEAGTRWRLALRAMRVVVAGREV
jgi:hypothetical protein